MLSVRYDGASALILPAAADREAFRLWMIANIRGNFRMYGDGLIVQLVHLEDLVAELSRAGFTIDA